MSNYQGYMRNCILRIWAYTQLNRPMRNLASPGHEFRTPIHPRAAEGGACRFSRARWRLTSARLASGTVAHQIPMHRLGTPDEVAKIIYVLCTKTSSYVNGAEIHINGGQHV